MAKHVPLPPEFRIPATWKWVKMADLVFTRTGYPFDSKRFSDDSSIGMPLIRIRDVVRGETNTYTDEACPEEYIIHQGDILIGMDGDFNVGKWKSNDGLLNQRVCYICSKSTALLNDYLYYYLPDPLKKINEVTPSITVKHLSNKTIEKASIPIPPLAEQHRIVDRIESLFAKLDEAKEKAQTVVDGFEDRKAAILHKAFTGELTEKWRCTHKHSSKEWNSIPFEECIDTMQNGIAKRKGTEGEPFIVIRLANLSDDSFLADDLREIVLDEKEQHNYELHQDDVIMIRVNGSKENVGKQYRVTNQKKWAFCDHLIRIHYTANVVSQYIVYYSKTKEYRQYIMDNMVSSAGQNTISRKGLSRLQLPIPSIEEQKEIVSLLDTHFEKENQAIDTAKKVIDQIDTMKKTILARAFRGELGTNDPNDESAIELLRKILK